MYDQSMQGDPMQDGNVPPEIMAHINPSDPFQAMLLERLDRLTPEQANAVKTGVSRAACEALKVALPEIGFILDRCGQGGSMPMQGQSAPRSALNNI